MMIAIRLDSNDLLLALPFLFVNVLFCKLNALKKTAENIVMHDIFLKAAKQEQILKNHFQE